MAEQPRVLVVDDDTRILELLASALAFAGFDVTTASNGAACLSQVTAEVDLLLLDVMLPDADGFEIVRLLRSQGHRVPVVFITARDAVDDRITGLRLGGDDYVTKPFDIGELVARIHAILRRARPDADEDDVLRLADLRFDQSRHEVWRGDRKVDLSPTEFRLLHYLLANAGRVVSKSQILDQVWQYDFGGDGSVVERFISSLRRKIDVGGPALIHTVRGFGYTIRESP